MKFSNISSARRKVRKANIGAPSSVRRHLMSAPLSKELRQKHHVKHLPIRKEDEIEVTRGSKKGLQGKVVSVYRKKGVIHVERIQREKVNGSTVFIGLNPSKVVITKIKTDKDRKAVLTRRDRSQATDKGKRTEQDVAQTQAQAQA